MNHLFNRLFVAGPFIPHGHCYLWKPGLVWLHVISDGLIALAYYSIPIALFYFVRRRHDLPFHGIFLLFAAFIVACGTTHVMEIWTLWHPIYWVSGTIKAATATVSVFTALELFPLVPAALALPSPAQLEQANQKLHNEIQERLRIEDELRQTQNQLELRIQERTAELVQINEQLQQEIHERQRAETAVEALNRDLQNRVSELETLFEVIPIGILITDDPQFEQVRANPAFTQILGVTAGNNVSSTPPVGMVHPGYQIFSEGQLLTPEETPLRRAALQGINVDRAEVDIHRDDGAVFNLYGYASPLFDDQGQVRGAVGAFLDITERKRYESEREQLLQQLASSLRQSELLIQAEQRARAEAEAANRVKDEFLAVLSHELRTPLNPILGWIRLLQAGALDPQKQRMALDTIERNARLQTQLIEDLLDISRILQGKFSLNVAPIDLAMTIEAAQETIRLAAEAKTIQIQMTLDRTMQPVLGDSNRLQQVFWNLLSNAVKFTPNGGQVQVRLEQVSGVEAIARPHSPSATYAQITVTDTGKGITPDFLPYVFEYFRQADSSTTRKFGGLGLGLAIVRQIVELHGGVVQAESLGEGMGATFTVWLPCAIAHSEAPTIDQPMAAAPEPLTDCAILLVDDDADSRDFITYVLEQQGAQVIAVASAVEALQALDQSVPDLLVSDIGMPVIDGYALMRQIRMRSTTLGGSIRAIALSAYAGEFDQQQAISAGFDSHLAKPVHPERLIQAIVHLLYSSRRAG